jgi:2-polyprenyl-3-methyl-5-hydroxy-6-metoxy-1,4-benzoquinol methylase
MAKKIWDKIEYLTYQQIQNDPYAWHKGYFIANGDLNTWWRNYNELFQRDIALFAVGDIREKDILDIGCGSGMYMLTFLKMGAQSASGIDIDDSLIQKGKEYMRLNNYEADMRVADCTKLPHASDCFDIVFSGDVFEHITETQKDQCIAEMYRVLRPGGVVVIKTPNISYLKLTLFFKRLKALFSFKNPFNIHIAHTRNNPDNEHIGLTNHKNLMALLTANMFHEPQITHVKLQRKGIPSSISTLLKKVLYLNQDIIVAARKPIFLGLYP